ncbi:MAG: anti-sigma factor antagonist [Chloroflexota bacterium]
MVWSKADLHMHSHYSDGLMPVEDIINFAITQTDLRVIAITDHNTISGSTHGVQYLAENKAQFQGLDIIQYSSEITTTKGDILALYIKKDIRPHMTPQETITAIHRQKGIAIAAHPYTHLLRWHDLVGVWGLIKTLNFDAVETRNSNITELWANYMARWVNQRHQKLPSVGGSDTHYLPTLGQTYTWFQGETAADFRQALQQGNVKAGGQVWGLITVCNLIVDLIRQRRLPWSLRNAKNYAFQVDNLQIKVQEHSSQVAQLKLSGRLNRDSVDLLKDKSTMLISAGFQYIVLDLEGLAFADSAGLGGIISLYKQLNRLKGKVVLCNPQPAITLLLKLVKLDKVLTIAPNIKQAFEYLAQAQQNTQTTVLRADTLVK